jgi:hypothetical protein
MLTIRRPVPTRPEAVTFSSMTVLDPQKILAVCNLCTSVNYLTPARRCIISFWGVLSASVETHCGGPLKGAND